MDIRLQGQGPREPAPGIFVVGTMRGQAGAEIPELSAQAIDESQIRDHKVARRFQLGMNSYFRKKKAGQA